MGIAAIQLVRVLARNTTVLTTSSSAEKLAVCQKYGADVLINYKESDFSEEVLRFTDNQGECQCIVLDGVTHSLVIFIANTVCSMPLGADLIIDFVGASYWERNIKSAAVDGRIVLLGLVILPYQVHDRMNGFSVLFWFVAGWGSHRRTFELRGPSS